MGLFDNPLALGAAIMQNNQGGFGNALAGGFQDYSLMQDRERQAKAQQAAAAQEKMIREMQLKQMLQEYRRSGEKNEAIDSYIASLPRKDQVRAKVDISSYLKSQQPADAPDWQRKYEWALQNPEQARQLSELGIIGRQGTTINIGDQLTPGQKKFDEEYAKAVVGFETGGEYADTEKQISQLEEAYSRLNDPDKNLTGPIIGRTPDFLLSAINPEAIDTRESIEEVVQRNLREILGAQFTEKEGEKLIARAYNPSLGEGVNRKRVGRLIAQMKSAYAAKKSAADYLKEKGTMDGWGGSLPTFRDFYDALEDEPQKKKSNESGVVDWSDL